jgi:hypothetical protein
VTHHRRGSGWDRVVETNDGVAVAFSPDGPKPAATSRAVQKLTVRDCRDPAAPRVCDVRSCAGCRGCEGVNKTDEAWVAALYRPGGLTVLFWRNRSVLNVGRCELRSHRPRTCGPQLSERVKHRRDARGEVRAGGDPNGSAPKVVRDQDAPLAAFLTAGVPGRRARRVRLAVASPAGRRRMVLAGPCVG